MKMVIYKSFHTIDVDSGQCIRRVIPPDFSTFINEYVDYAAQNDSVKYYTIKSEHTTVVHCIDQLVNDAMADDGNEEELQFRLNQFSQVIADKLVSEEQEAQARIRGTGKRIKKGSLVQAFIKTDDQEYLYIIAKVEHTEYFDGESLEKSFGFPSEKKNVWKSAVFPLSVEQGVIFDTVRVYTDNDAKYWAAEFLELNETRNDKDNTSVAYTAIDQELKRRVRKISERDYWILNNSVYQKMRTQHLLNYPEMVNELLTGYEAECPELDIESLKTTLLALPTNKNFDTQFNTVPSVLDRKRHLKYPLMPNIELRINGTVEDIKGDIVSFTDEQGTRYIKIKCHDTKTYQAFSSAQ